ncbi:MAG: PLP-dependent transferase [Gammaproteobacteria bacterium]
MICIGRTAVQFPLAASTAYLPPRIGGAVEMPIFQSAMYEYAGEASYHDLGYIRLNNTPNHKALHGKLAALEGAEAALVTASGWRCACATRTRALCGSQGSCSRGGKCPT